MVNWKTDFPSFWLRVAIRIGIFIAFIGTESLVPFERVIQPEEQWLYRYPRTDPFISTPGIYTIIVVGAIGTILIFLAIKRSLGESWEAFLVPSLAVPLTGFIANTIKSVVGRPRPDFLDRCYPGLNALSYDLTLPCTGDYSDVVSGRKSFPSGHTAMTFASLGFVSLYLAGQLGTFNCHGRRKTWRLLVTLLPLVLATLIGASRTADYHHHWQDVAVGGTLGLLVVFTIYRQYFPSPSSSSSQFPFLTLVDSQQEQQHQPRKQSIGS